MPANVNLASAPSLSGSPASLSRPDTTRRHEPWTIATIVLVTIAVAIRIFFWFYTQRNWEDALITVQHAENAARGLGLTHTPGGPHVHGFTSALSVLIPLLGEFLHHGLGLPLLKFVSAICGGIAVWLAMRICRRLEVSFPIALLIAGYLAIEHHQILFGMAGMETQVAVTVLLFAIDSLIDMRPLRVGLSLALCPLARPDFGFWVVFLLLLVAWRGYKSGRWDALETSIFALLVISGPWIAFTTWYYGSPLPNTILAKAFGFGNNHGVALPWYRGVPVPAIIGRFLARLRSLIAVLGPAYGGNGTGFATFPFDPQGIISCIVFAFTMAGTVACLYRRQIVYLSIAGFITGYLLYYLFLVEVIALWYCIPFAAIAMLAAGIGLDATLSRLRGIRWRIAAAYAVAGAYLAVLIAVTPITINGERNIQRYVEDQVRKRIGLYLADNTRPDQTIGCEPLGYIGYYSRREMFAYPGMTNPQVVRFVREHPDQRNLVDMLDYFRPDYIALRPLEYKLALRQGKKWLVTDYEMVADFSTPDYEKEQLLFPNQNLDTEFYLLKRRSAALP